MIRSVRAAGVAAAVFGFAVSTIFAAAPSEAVETAPSFTFGAMTHADASMADGSAGMNGAEAYRTEQSDVEMAERVMRIAEAAVPRPRSLTELVGAYARTSTADDQQDCLASAVYFEARGEPIAGQLAVAEVVLNRVASERYPDTICEVVEQPWQFSFVNATGRIPNANRDSDSWRRAVAIARIAQAGVAREVNGEVLWYHADYVSPSWGRRLDRQEKIGLHIFYS